MDFLAYLPIYPIIVLVLFAGILLGIRLARPKFGYFWLVAALGTLVAWPLVLVAHGYLPGVIGFPEWKLGAYTVAIPRLMLDEQSWPFAFALATLALSQVLTDVARASEADWSSWAGGLFIVALGLLAVMAGNPVTLLMSWAAIDFAELLILLGQIEKSDVRERLVVAFSARVAGIILLAWAGIKAHSFSMNLSDIMVSAEVNIYLLLAAGLRLGVLPLHQPFIRDVPLRRGLGTMLRLVPAAASLTVLARMTSVGVPLRWTPVLLILTSLAGLYAAYSWTTAANELDGRPFWLLGMASFAVTASVIGAPAASLAWGIAALMGGGIIFFYSARQRYLQIFVWLAAIGLTTLPYTPSWNGAELYTRLNIFWIVPYLLSHLLIIAGYLRHGLRSTPQITGLERWVWLIYPWGLSLLIIAHYLIGYWSWQTPIRFAAIWPGITICGVFIVWNVLLQRKRESIYRWLKYIEKGNQAITHFLSLSWIYRILWAVYRYLSRFASFLSYITEGEGGVLWSLLLLVLALTFLSQLGTGG